MIVATVAVVAVGAAALVIFRGRRIKRYLSGGLVAILVASGLTLDPKPQAAADIFPDSGASEQAAACLSFFRRPGNDPAGIMGDYGPEMPPVYINAVSVERNGGGTATHRVSGNPYLGSVINWDPHLVVNLDGVDFHPCVSLYHELVHASDNMHGNERDAKCPGTDVSITDIRAIAGENGLRPKFDLPPREAYHGNSTKGLDYTDCLQKARDEAERRRNSRSAIDKFFRGRMHGDPHLVTFDGRAYDLRAVGSSKQRHRLPATWRCKFGPPRSGAPRTPPL